MKNFALVTQLDLIKRSIAMNLEGISNEESCHSTEGGNSMNWIMGHLVANSEAIFNALGLPDEIKDIKKWDALYDRGTSNVNCDNAIHLSEIMDVYNSTHDKMIKLLGETDLDEANLKIVARMIFHEAYHDGQLGTLRRVIGKDSALK